MKSRQRSGNSLIEDSPLLSRETNASSGLSLSLQRHTQLKNVAHSTMLYNPANSRRTEPSHARTALPTCNVLRNTVPLLLRLAVAHVARLLVPSKPSPRPHVLRGSFSIPPQIDHSNQTGRESERIRINGGETMMRYTKTRDGRTYFSNTVIE
ncbi:hypothetical protein NEOLEDRAFT_1136112 [Neolentinus lepideus HHB14362 ss-1]|uniref:Uncharacterized protein n=1 Tax=Neolentinus lepideus HHB14362 ss-1 TaxID=1314782 RepID=A0A165RD58_9AGAM|nr:hypothetical protein NEOLEDRAFT_1136112 [Neolentinus lepideus HHB14362 ss-1]